MAWKIVSLLMLFAARKLRLHPALKNPTVMVVVDRIDLDSQISSTFYAADAPNLVKAESRQDLQDLLEKDVRKIIITTIFKFGEAEGVLNERDNIIALVDEAHRTQEGNLGRKMREALPNAFLVGKPTRGSSGNPKPLVLPNGVTVTYSRWVSMLPDGTPIEGRGVRPDIEVEHAAQGDPTLDAAIAALTKRLGK